MGKPTGFQFNWLAVDTLPGAGEKGKEMHKAKDKAPTSGIPYNKQVIPADRLWHTP